MHNTERAIQFLRDIDRSDLAALIRLSTFRVIDEPVWDDINVAVVELSSPAVFDEALRGLSDWEQKRILEALIKSADAATLGGHTPERLAFKVADAPRSLGSDALIAEVFIHANEM